MAEEKLTAWDRCDRCGAQAQHRWQFESGELLFCGHHTDEYAGALAGYIAKEAVAAKAES